MKILLIEDESEIVDFLKPALEREGFAVDVAIDGADGAFMAKTNEHDLLIVDMMLPKLDGLAVCRTVREAGKTMPIMMLSVAGGAERKAELLNAGADDYMTKPFSFEELTARLKALLRRPKEIRDGVLRAGDLTMDVDKHIVRRNGRSIRLAPKEFMLLKELMLASGAVVSRNALLERVWDINADPFSNTVEAHIMSVRKKIDGPGEPKLIHTVHGVGYRVDTVERTDPQPPSTGSAT